MHGTWPENALVVVELCSYTHATHKLLGPDGGTDESLLLCRIPPWLWGNDLSVYLPCFVSLLLSPTSACCKGISAVRAVRWTPVCVLLPSTSTLYVPPAQDTILPRRKLTMPSPELCCTSTAVPHSSGRLGTANKVTACAAAAAAPGVSSPQRGGHTADLSSASMPLKLPPCHLRCADRDFTRRNV